MLQNGSWEEAVIGKDRRVQKYNPGHPVQPLEARGEKKHQIAPNAGKSQSTNARKVENQQTSSMLLKIPITVVISCRKLNRRPRKREEDGSNKRSPLGTNKRNPPL